MDDTLLKLEAAGETLLPAIKEMLEIYDPKPLSAAEVLKVSSPPRCTASVQHIPVAKYREVRRKAKPIQRSIP